MFNYRRVYTSSAKFKQITKGIKSPFFLNTRTMTLISVGLLVDLVLIIMFHLYTTEHNGWTYTAFLLMDLPLIGFLDAKIRVENLPVEVVIKMFISYTWLYVVQRNQLYQDKRLNTNNKKYRFL